MRLDVETSQVDWVLTLKHGRTARTIKANVGMSLPSVAPGGRKSDGDRLFGLYAGAKFGGDVLRGRPRLPRWAATMRRRCAKFRRRDPSGTKRCERTLSG